MTAFSFSRHNTSRADRFRQRHRVGDILKGEVETYISSNRAWVRINDLQLVAAIRPDLKPHSTLLFRVQSLHPDIVLAECGPSEPSVQICIQQFSTARTHFEALIAMDAGSDWTKNLHQRLRTEACLLRPYLAVQAKLALLNRQLDNGQRVAYYPWLFPILAESVLVFTPALSGTAIGEILGHGVLPSAEHIWIQATFITGQCRLRCFAPKGMVQHLARVEWADPAHSPVRSPWERLRCLSTKTHYQTTI